MKRHPAVRLLESRRVASGRVFELLAESIELPSGLRQDLLVVEHPGAVAIVPLFDDHSVLLVRQYRHAIGEWLLEIPAGRCEPGEALEATARRELEEEAGLRARTVEALASFYPAPGFCSERITLFLARGLSPVAEGRAPLDPDEELELVRLPLHEALEAVASDGKSWIALSRAVARLATSPPG